MNLKLELVFYDRSWRIIYNSSKLWDTKDLNELKDNLEKYINKELEEIKKEIDRIDLIEGLDNGKD